MILIIAFFFLWPTIIFAQNITEVDEIELSENNFQDLYNAEIHITLKTVYVYGNHKFKNDKQRDEYNKLVRDICKTYPYAKFIAKTIIETYEMMETMPDAKSKQKHLESVKKDLQKIYMPKMKKLTAKQGQILMKLIDRECGKSSFHIVKAIIGNAQANSYNFIAGLFGNSLKTRYEPQGKDRDIEDVLILVKQGIYKEYPL